MKRAFPIIAMLAFVGTGCTYHWTESLVKIDAPQAEFTEKVLLFIAISVPDENETISTWLQPEIIGDFPMGVLINNKPRDILQSFYMGTVAKDRRIPPAFQARNRSGKPSLIVNLAQNVETRAGSCSRNWWRSTFEDQQWRNA